MLRLQAYAQMYIMANNNKPSWLHYVTGDDIADKRKNYILLLLLLE